jgi:hypothetical protein
MTVPNPFPDIIRSNGQLVLAVKSLGHSPDDCWYLGIDVITTPGSYVCTFHWIGMPATKSTVTLVALT